MPEPGDLRSVYLNKCRVIGVTPNAKIVKRLTAIETTGSRHCDLGDIPIDTSYPAVLDALTVSSSLTSVSFTHCEGMSDNEVDQLVDCLDRGAIGIKAIDLSHNPLITATGGQLLLDLLTAGRSISSAVHVNVHKTSIPPNIADQLSEKKSSVTKVPDGNHKGPNTPAQQQQKSLPSSKTTTPTTRLLSEPDIPLHLIPSRRDPLPPRSNASSEATPTPPSGKDIVHPYRNGRNGNKIQVHQHHHQTQSQQNPRVDIVLTSPGGDENMLVRQRTSDGESLTPPENTLLTESNARLSSTAPIQIISPNALGLNETPRGLPNSNSCDSIPQSNNSSFISSQQNQRQQQHQLRTQRLFSMQHALLTRVLMSIRWLFAIYLWEDIGRSVVFLFITLAVVGVPFVDTTPVVDSALLLSGLLFLQQRMARPPMMTSAGAAPHGGTAALNRSLAATAGGNSMENMDVQQTQFFAAIARLTGVLNDNAGMQRGRDSRAPPLNRYRSKRLSVLQWLSSFEQRLQSNDPARVVHALHDVTLLLYRLEQWVTIGPGRKVVGVLLILSYLICVLFSHIVITFPLLCAFFLHIPFEVARMQIKRWGYVQWMLLGLGEITGDTQHNSAQPTRLRRYHNGNGGPAALNNMSISSLASAASNGSGRSGSLLDNSFEMPVHFSVTVRHLQGTVVHLSSGMAFFPFIQIKYNRQTWLTRKSTEPYVWEENSADPIGSGTVTSQLGGRNQRNFPTYFKAVGISSVASRASDGYESEGSNRGDYDDERTELVASSNGQQPLKMTVTIYDDRAEVVGPALVGHVIIDECMRFDEDIVVSLCALEQDHNSLVHELIDELQRADIANRMRFSHTHEAAVGARGIGLQDGSLFTGAHILQVDHPGYIILRFHRVSPGDNENEVKFNAAQHLVLPGRDELCSPSPMSARVTAAASSLSASRHNSHRNLARRTTAHMAPPVQHFDPATQRQKQQHHQVSTSQMNPGSPHLMSLMPSPLGPLSDKVGLKRK